jgi:hypothetical protein
MERHGTALRPWPARGPPPNALLACRNFFTAFAMQRIVGGKMLLFLSRLPSVGFASLKMREDQKLLGAFCWFGRELDGPC